MDLRELQYIVTIADEGSISRAAEKLFMAQSSLSQALAQFEADLGTPIFRRTSRGVRPTASGEIFIAHVRQILQQYRSAKNEVWESEQLGGGCIELGISTFRGVYLLPPVLKRFHQQYPDIHVEIKEMDSADLEESILDGLLDIAVVTYPPVHLKQNVEPFMRDEFLIIATDDHPVMRYARPAGQPGEFYVSFADTTPFEYIIGPPDTVLGRMVRSQFRACGREPVGSNVNVTAPFAAAMARQGLGLAVTYRSCSVPEPNVHYLRIGREGIFLDLALAYPTGHYQSRAAHALGLVFRDLYPYP